MFELITELYSSCYVHVRTAIQVTCLRLVQMLIALTFLMVEFVVCVYLSVYWYTQKVYQGIVVINYATYVWSETKQLLDSKSLHLYKAICVFFINKSSRLKVILLTGKCQLLVLIIFYRTL